MRFRAVNVNTNFLLLAFTTHTTFEMFRNFAGLYMYIIYILTYISNSSFHESSLYFHLQQRKVWQCCHKTDTEHVASFSSWWHQLSGYDYRRIKKIALQYDLKNSPVDNNLAIYNDYNDFTIMSSIYLKYPTFKYNDNEQHYIHIVTVRIVKC